MPNHVLVAVDGSPQSEAALGFLNEEWLEVDVTLLCVIDPSNAGYTATAGIPSGAEEWYENARKNAEETLSDARDLVQHERVETEIEVGRPAPTIVEHVKDGGPDHIIVGSHGRTGVSRILLGSVAESVVRNAPVPVTVVR